MNESNQQNNLIANSAYLNDSKTYFDYNLQKNVTAQTNSYQSANVQNKNYNLFNYNNFNENESYGVYF